MTSPVGAHHPSHPIVTPPAWHGHAVCHEGVRPCEPVLGHHLLHRRFHDCFEHGVCCWRPYRACPPFRLDFVHAIGAELDVYRPFPPREVPAPSPKPVPVEKHRPREGLRPEPLPVVHYGAPKLSDVAPVPHREPAPVRRVIQRVEVAPFRGRLIDLVV